MNSVRIFGFCLFILSLLVFPETGFSQQQNQRPIYLGGQGKFIGGLGIHGEIPVGPNLTIRGEAGWLVFVLDMNAGIGYSFSPKLEIYTTFHATLMSFIGSTVALGPELGADIRLTDVFHIEAGAILLMNESAQEVVPNIGITVNIPLRD